MPSCAYVPLNGVIIPMRLGDPELDVAVVTADEVVVELGAAEDVVCVVDVGVLEVVVVVGVVVVELRYKPTPAAAATSMITITTIETVLEIALEYLDIACWGRLTNY